MRQDAGQVRRIIEYRAAKQAAAWADEGEQGAAMLTKNPQLIDLMKAMTEAQLGGSDG